MLTKSLHTVTAVTNVARHLMITGAGTSAVSLTRQALAVLGYEMRGFDAQDETVQRCVAAVSKALTERPEVPAAAPRRARQYFDEYGRKVDAVYTSKGDRVALTGLR